MAAQLDDSILDAALTELDDATIIHICSAEPTNYANVASVTVGNKNFGAGGCFGAPAAATGGRKCSSTAVTDGTVTDDGVEATWACAVDGSRLLAKTPLASGQVVYVANGFTLASWDVTLLHG